MFSNPFVSGQEFYIAAFYEHCDPLASPISHLTDMTIESERVHKALALSNTLFKRLFGVKRVTFNKMLGILQEAYETFIFNAHERRALFLF